MRFEMLKIAPFDQISLMFNALKIDFDQHAVQKATERSSEEKIQRAQSESEISWPSRFKDGFQFASKGESGDWKNYFSDDDLQYYRKVCQGLNYFEYPA